MVLVLKNGIDACWRWVSQLFASMPGFIPLYLVMFLIFCCYRFILRPFLADVNLGSDKAISSLKKKYFASSGKSSKPKKG